jgi:ABC-type dipeptide/oligopeptide/nickel transport system permease subunit
VIAILALLAIALYGPIVAAHDPFETHSLYAGKPPPFDPSPDFPLGTDALGRDRLSWLLFGARTTFSIALAAAALRVMGGVCLGVAAAWTGGTAELVVSRIALALSSVPATIGTCLAVLAFNAGADVVALILALSLLGWADAFHHARRSTHAEASRPYIESARAVGAGEMRVILRHLAPNFAPSLLTVAALQVASVLLLLGELALLRVFLGGSVSTDLYGVAIVLPSQPEWSSTLGSTRPIFDLYGNAIAVVAPASALLFAVVSFNLFGDAIARRAQTLDLFHLFTRRELAAVASVAVVLVGPAVLWPGRLASEVAYGADFDTARAARVMRELAGAQFAGRLTQTAEADAAGQRIAELIGGAAFPFEALIQRATSASLTLGDARVSLGPGLTPLSQHSGTFAGEVVVTEPIADLTRSSTAKLLRDKIVLVRNVTSTTVSFAARVLSAAEAGAVIVLSDEDLEPQAVSVPMLRLSPRRLREFIPTSLPDIQTGSPVLPLGINGVVDLTITSLAVHGTNAVIHVNALQTGAPVVVVVAPYDEGRRAGPGWASASAAGVLVAAAERVRALPLSADVTFVAAAAHSLSDAGLSAALGSLNTSERSRLAAVIVVQSAQALTTTIRADAAAAANPGGGPSVVARVASATGQKYAAQRTQQLLRSVLASGVRVPTFELESSAESEAEPSADALRATGRALLTLLDYIATHPSELHP